VILNWINLILKKITSNLASYKEIQKIVSAFGFDADILEDKETTAS